MKTHITASFHSSFTYHMSVFSQNELVIFFACVLNILEKGLSSKQGIQFGVGIIFKY